MIEAFRYPRKVPSNHRISNRMVTDYLAVDPETGRNAGNVEPSGDI